MSGPGLASGATIASLTNAGSLTFSGYNYNGAGLGIQGQIVNSGLMQSAGSSTTNSLWVPAGQMATLSGSGQVLLNGGYINYTYNGTAGILTNQDNLIHGWGYIQGGSVFNNSTIAADSSGHTLYLYSSQTNNGTYLAENGGTLNIAGSLVQISGGTLAGGTWIARGGSRLLVSSGGSITTNQAAVVLDGAGSAFPNINALASNQGRFAILDGQSFSTTGSLVNAGTVNVDAVSGLTVAGPYSALPSSLTTIDGNLVFAGTANLQGLLQGSGSAQGSVNISAGGGIAPGRIAAVGTFSVAGNLAFASGSSLDIDINETANSLLSVGGSLSFGGAATLAIAASGPLGGSYTLAAFGHTNAQPSSFSVVGAPSGYGLEIGANNLALVAASWASAASGSWNDSTKWSFGSVPSGAGILATVGAATSMPLTITLDGQQTLGTLDFTNTAGNTTGYNLAAGSSGSLVLDNLGGGAQIVVSGGRQTISANVTLNDSLTVAPSAGTTLRISGDIGDGGLGKLLLLNGPGTLELSGTGTYTGGTTVERGTLIVTNETAIENGTNLYVGSGLTVFGTVVPAEAARPALTAVPEPGTLALLAAMATFVLLPRRRMR